MSRLVIQNEALSQQYCAARSGYYGNYLGAITGVEGWSTAKHHIHIPKEQEDENKSHLNKWLKDNDQDPKDFEECGAGGGRGGGVGCIIC